MSKCHVSDYTVYKPRFSRPQYELGMSTSWTQGLFKHLKKTLNCIKSPSAPEFFFLVSRRLDELVLDTTLYRPLHS